MLARKAAVRTPSRGASLEIARRAGLGLHSASALWGGAVLGMARGELQVWMCRCKCDPGVMDQQEHGAETERMGLLAVGCTMPLLCGRGRVGNGKGGRERCKV